MARDFGTEIVEIRIIKHRKVILFGLSIPTWGFLILWGLFLWLMSRLESPIARGLRLRITTLLGFVLVGTAYFFQPWVKFEFLDYIIPTPAFLSEIMSGGLALNLVELLGVEWMNKLLRVFHLFTNFNGWQIEFIPTLGVWLRISTLLPMVPFILSFFTVIIGSTYRGSRFARVLGWVMVILSLTSAFNLLMALPELDALGIRNSFQWALLATVLGTRIGNGPWLCIIGLLLIAIGGFVEIQDRNPDPSSENDASYLYE